MEVSGAVTFRSLFPFLLLLPIACDVPTAPPRIETTWRFPTEPVEVPVAGVPASATSTEDLSDFDLADPAVHTNGDGSPADGNGGSGFALDVGLGWDSPDGFSVGIAVQNIVTRLRGRRRVARLDGIAGDRRCPVHERGLHSDGRGAPYRRRPRVPAGSLAPAAGRHRGDLGGAS